MLNLLFRYIAGSVLLVLLAVANGAMSSEDTSGLGNNAILLEVDGAIGPVTSEYILRGFKYAEESNAELVVIQIDTPGGLVNTTREIIKGMLSSPVPVAIYVAPNGARAASAGTYLLYASHIAAMAPATTLGSATPVQMGGFPGLPDKSKQSKKEETKTASSGEEGADEVAVPASAMERKIINDAAAYIRSLAELRGRNAEWAEKAVREAVDLTATEAVDQNVVDLIAEDLTELLSAIHGRQIKVNDKMVTLDTDDITVEYFKPDWRTQFLSVITDPNIVFVLLLLAFYGLVYEFLNPGMFVPGVIGAVSLLLALYALQILPVNYAGLALMLLGIAFLLAEAFVPSFGILGVGGVIAFSIGAIILFNEKGYSISISIIIGNAIISFAFFVWIVGMLARIRKRPMVSGKEQMLGAIGVVSDDFEKEGYVLVMGERWKAISNTPLKAGQEVFVKSIDGLLIKVELKN